MSYSHSSPQIHPSNSAQQNQFQRNLNFLQKAQPQLANLMSRHQPTEVLSAPDLVNDIRYQGQPFYNMNGKQAASLQVQHYMKSPTHFSLKYRSIPGNRYLHQAAINQLNQHAVTLNYRGDGKPEISNLLALGSGLGFHISALRQHMSFANVIIVEPNNDMLWHLLHHLDLPELSEHCYHCGGHVSIVQPGSYQEFATKLHTLAKRSGFAMFSEISVFRHYETPLFDEILENFKALRNQQVSAWGFINDEFIGLRHSLLNRHLPFAVSPAKQGDNTSASAKPVVVVGNGPSLDKDLAQLIASRSQFTLISCGTALGTLLKNDIIPDFHAEMERSSFTANVQQQWLTKQVCERVTLLALNTVSTDITHKFNKVLLFAKGNDIGTEALNRGTEQALTPLKYCNPTVTNFAVTAACALNMTRLVLLGCDYGFRSQQHHHAKQSEYFNQNSRLANIAPKNEISVPDNHGGSVFSSRILTLSRENIEAALSRNPHMQVVNCSDGAKIKHTTWQPFEQVVSKTNSNQAANQTDNNHPYQSFLLNTDTKQIATLFNYYIEVAGELTSLARNQTANIVTMQKNLQNIDNHLQTLATDARADVFFSGSARYLAVTIAGHLYRIPKQKHGLYCQFAQSILQTMFEKSAEFLAELKKETLS